MINITSVRSLNKTSLPLFPDGLHYTLYPKTMSIESLNVAKKLKILSVTIKPFKRSYVFRGIFSIEIQSLFGIQTAQRARNLFVKSPQGTPLVQGTPHSFKVGRGSFLGQLSSTSVL